MSTYRTVIRFPVLACLPVALASAAAEPAGEMAAMPARAKFHLYLLTGQSNMVGRAPLDAAAGRTHPHVLMLDGDRRWVPARDPLVHPDDGGAGVGMGMAFARVVAESDPSVTIGLVPCAVGGTPLSRWVKGADLYETAVARARAAAASGVLKGVLWHQGESDSVNAELSTSYGRRLGAMFADLRRDLAAPDVPIVVGELGPFLTRAPSFSRFRVVNEQLHRVAADVPHVACASAVDLVDGGDDVHFSGESLRRFGVRYALHMLRLQGQLLAMPSP